MEVRTTLAALALLLAGAAHAAPVGTAYSQAQDLAGGSPAGRIYDGSNMSDAVSAQVGGALTTGGLTVPTVSEVPSRSLLAPRAVPRLADASPREPFFSSRALLYGGTGAAAGAAAGWFLGGPIGALIGAAAGFAIGFLLSKFLH